MTIDKNTTFLEDHRTAEEIFEARMPESLYMTHYELHEEHPHISRDEWRRFLQDHDRFILKETAILTEALARKALNRLGTSDLKQGDATAISQLLKQSEQINQQTKDKTQYVMMYMPDPATRKVQDKSRNAVYTENRNNLRHFFDGELLQRRLERGEIYLNADGTMHVINHSTFSSSLDKAYLSLFNPDNKKVTTLEGEDDREWQ